MGASNESRRRIHALDKALEKMKASSSEASQSIDEFTKRARQLDSLISPASDASGLLSKASNNLSTTLLLMRDAREKFDTIRDCEPAIERLKSGVAQLQNGNSGNKQKARLSPFEDGRGKVRDIVLTEQDIYAASDSMEIIREAHGYFLEKKNWRSAPAALAALERVHQMGVSSMCMLASSHLIKSGHAVRMKRIIKKEGEANVTSANETAIQVRKEPIFRFFPPLFCLTCEDSRSVSRCLAKP